MFVRDNRDVNKCSIPQPFSPYNSPNAQNMINGRLLFLTLEVCLGDDGGVPSSNHICEVN